MGVSGEDVSGGRRSGKRVDFQARRERRRMMNILKLLLAFILLGGTAILLILRSIG